jgi:hypothetical protein
MTTSQIKEYLTYMKNVGQVWDLYDQAIALADQPTLFEQLIKKLHSPLVYSLLFEDSDNAPLYINATSWLAHTAKWVLKNDLNQ